MLLTVGGCAADARRAGRDDAAGSANQIAFFLRNFVVRPHAARQAQLTSVMRWLTKPPVADLDQVGRPEFRVLTSVASAHIDIAVWAFGRTTAIEGKRGAWGHVCNRYTIPAAGGLVVTTIDCPRGLPEQPD